MMANIAEMQLLKKAAEKLKGKSDEELIQEIRKLKSVLSDDDQKLKQQLANLKPFREMLDEEQKHKFDLIMQALNEE